LDLILIEPYLHNHNLANTLLVRMLELLCIQHWDSTTLLSLQIVVCLQLMRMKFVQT